MNTLNSYRNVWQGLCFDLPASVPLRGGVLNLDPVGGTSPPLLPRAKIDNSLGGKSASEKISRS